MEEKSKFVHAFITFIKGLKISGRNKRDVESRLRNNNTIVFIKIHIFNS